MPALALLWKYRLLVAIALAFGFGWYVKGVFVKAEHAAAMAEIQKMKDDLQHGADEAAADWEKKLRKLREETRARDRRLTNEINSNDVYSSCVVPAGGVRSLADAISGRDAAGKPNE